MPDGYRTLSGEGAREFTINKSRFIGYGAPCRTEEEALSFLARIRAKHKDATHNCYAYVIGKNAGIMRYSDDGEPGGTAGLPIMQVIRTRGIVDCAVVVTRYFGGVLLGAGGLVRAYTEGCKSALEASGIVFMQKTVRMLAEVDYSTWQRLQYMLLRAACIIENTEYAAAVVTTLLVPAALESSFVSQVNQISDGRAALLREGELYYPWPENTQEKKEKTADPSIRGC